MSKDDVLTIPDRFPPGRARGDKLQAQLFSTGAVEIQVLDKGHISAIVLNRADAVKIATWLLDRAMSGRIEP